MVTPESTQSQPPKPRRKYVPVVGPALRKVLILIFALFALIMVNSVYLVSIRVLGLSTGDSYENWFFLNMFIAHLVLGLAIVVPIIIFGIFHIRNARNRPNRRAVRAGYALFTTAIILLITGILLMRIDGLIVIKDQTARSILWWAHVITPLLVMWLFVLHRLAVEAQRELKRIGVGHHCRRHDHRPQRQHSRPRFSGDPVKAHVRNVGATDMVADADVVGDGIARDMIERLRARDAARRAADHRRQFEFPVDLRAVGGQDERIAGAGEAAERLDEGKG